MEILKGKSWQDRKSSKLHISSIFTDDCKMYIYEFMNTASYQVPSSIQKAARFFIPDKEEGWVHHRLM